MNSTVTVSPDKTVIRERFSKAAGFYDRYADHHRIIAERLMDFAPRSLLADPVLEIGCGTGILTGKLVEYYPDSRLTALDISPTMIRCCQSKLNRSKNVSFLVADAEVYCRQANRFSLVVSSCSLQWFHDRQRFIDSVYSILPSGGSCLMAIPVKGMLRELEESFVSGTGKTMRQLDLGNEIEWINRFRNSGMDISLSAVENVACSYENPLEVLKAIRGIGAGIEQNSALFNTGDMRRMMKYYLKHFSIDSNGAVSSTYRVLYVLGRKY